MLYQKNLPDENPFLLILQENRHTFAEHRHFDIEFNYVIRGSVNLTVGREHRTVRAGEVNFIAAGKPHEFFGSDEDNLIMTAVVGLSFLRKFYDAFADASLGSQIITLDDSSEVKRRLRLALDRIVENFYSGSENAEMLKTAWLYEACAYLFEALCGSRGGRGESAVRTEANVEKALELIYYDYKSRITVDDAARLTGYGKSNFCRIFKRVTGMGFHKALNERRIKKACELLSETDLPVSEVGFEVGIPDAKSFCRTFKETVGTTPGAWRTERRQ